MAKPDTHIDSYHFQRAMGTEWAWPVGAHTFSPQMILHMSADSLQALFMKSLFSFYTGKQTLTFFFLFASLENTEIANLTWLDW